MPHRRLHHALAPLLVAVPLSMLLASSAVFARQNGAGFTVTSDNPAAVDRLTDTATRTLKELVEWLGPLSGAPLRIVDLPWGRGTPGESQPGVAATRVRWLSPVRDVSAERALIAAMARQFWFAAVTAETASFHEGLAVYTGTKTIHRVLEGRNFAAPRFIGDFVPLPLRSLVLSPNQTGRGAPLGEFDEVLRPFDAPWRFASTADDSPARRADAALRTLERVIGWPAMQQALAAVRERAAGGPISPEMFAAVVAEQRGAPVEWFVRDLVRSNDRVDYAVGVVSSSRSGDTVRTAIGIDRLGPGVFSGTDRPRAAGPAQSVPVLVRFADGSHSRAIIDGRDQHSELVIESYSPAMVVAIDPDEMVLVDADRVNNGWASGAPMDRNGLRLVLNWMMWLQNVMLTYTAVA